MYCWLAAGLLLATFITAPVADTRPGAFYFGKEGRAGTGRTMDCFTSNMSTAL